MTLTYPAILTQEDNVFYIGFPDLQRQDNENDKSYLYSTYGNNVGEAVEMGKEYLVLMLSDYEDNKINFPKPSTLQDVKKNLKSNQDIIYLSINYEFEKSLISHNYIKKTLTIPSYLDILAKNKNINFSQVLQKALKKELGIEK